MKKLYAFDNFTPMHSCLYAITRLLREAGFGVEETYDTVNNQRLYQVSGHCHATLSTKNGENGAGTLTFETTSSQAAVLEGAFIWPQVSQYGGHHATERGLID